MVVPGGEVLGVEALGVGVVVEEGEVVAGRLDDGDELVNPEEEFPHGGVLPGVQVQRRDGGGAARERRVGVVLRRRAREDLHQKGCRLSSSLCVSTKCSAVGEGAVTFSRSIWSMAVENAKRQLHFLIPTARDVRTPLPCAVTLS